MLNLLNKLSFYCISPSCLHLPHLRKVDALILGAGYGHLLNTHNPCHLKCLADSIIYSI